MGLLKVATCNLNQWAMDFDRNLKNIKESITKAKEAGAVIRLGPELEITGSECEDHFLELDTVNHSWECLKEILVGDYTDGILCSIGMPVMRGSQRYNCQILCCNRKILMIRPKFWLANDGNFRESRWFTAWKQRDHLEEFQLPPDVAEALSITSVPFGYGYIQFLDTAVAAEFCEELFAPIPPHANGSHHQLRKLDVSLRASIGATHTRGRDYMYSNHQGCDGARFYYGGCSCIAVNGDVVAQGSQFSFKDVEILVAQVHLDTLCSTKVSSITVKYHTLEEIAFGTGCWMWDLLRSSGASFRRHMIACKVASRLDVSIDIVISSLLSLCQALTGKYPLYKYDCSSADINPIGSISKQDHRAFLRWAAVHLEYSSLPDAELDPIVSNYSQIYSPEDNWFDNRQIFDNSKSHQNILWKHLVSINRKKYIVGASGEHKQKEVALDWGGGGMGVLAAGSVILELAFTAHNW
ncbi:hypothetical protein MKX03_001401 [Papaver bracteatum]|nr:hypothetical protein MKX03_001401 [Papaver bracteatum]